MANLNEPFLSACADAIAQHAPFTRADWIVVCGSGIHHAFIGSEASIADLHIETTLPLAALGMPTPLVAGHGQALVFARLAEKKIVFQTGRVHPYEGHPITHCLAALQALLLRGCDHLLLTCAVGGIHPGLRNGSIVVLRDQIGLFGPTPLIGSHFVDCSELYAKPLRDRVQNHAMQMGNSLFEAVYGHARGPQYETPSEVEALRRLGADVVGMSTTYEAILAAAYRTPCVGLGVVTNAAGDKGLSHLEVQERAKEARTRLATLVQSLVRES
jgi:purine-nucleoside phosphorylase